MRRKMKYESRQFTQLRIKIHVKVNFVWRKKISPKPNAIQNTECHFICQRSIVRIPYIRYECAGENMRTLHMHVFSVIDELCCRHYFSIIIFIFVWLVYDFVISSHLPLAKWPFFAFIFKIECDIFGVVAAVADGERNFADIKLFHFSFAEHKMAPMK